LVRASGRLTDRNSGRSRRIFPAERRLRSDNLLSNEVWLQPSFRPSPVASRVAHAWEWGRAEFTYLVALQPRLFIVDVRRGTWTST
jgi:hypothetical protein